MEIDDMELVSIITPAYNSAEFIGEMIESIITQTYPHWELLITDDCSEDNTIEIVKSYSIQEPRIKLFILKRNSGAAVARNNSLKEAEGRFIAFCDSDDLWKPEKLEKQIKFLLKNNYQFVCCQTAISDMNNKIIGINKRIPKISFRKTLIINYLGTSAVLYDTKEIGKIYFRNIIKRQDWMLWLDILKKTGYAYCLSEVLTVRRIRHNSLSSNKKKLFRYYITIYNEYLRYPKVLAYIIFYGISLPCLLYKKIKIQIDSKNHLKSIAKGDV